MNLENTKVYTTNPEVIRKYAELCGVKVRVGNDVGKNGKDSIGIASSLHDCFTFSELWDKLHGCERVIITDNEVNTLYTEEFGKVETPKWDGKGLPPVGTECRYFVANPLKYSKDNHLRRMTCVAHAGVNKDLAVLVSEDYSFSTVCNEQWIRPIETEAQRKQREFAEKWVKRFQEEDCSLEDILNEVYKEFHQG